MDELQAQIDRTIELARSEHSTREMALVITKLQEAKLWLLEHAVQLDNKVKQHTARSPKARR